MWVFLRSIVSLAAVLALVAGISVLADSVWVTHQAARLVIGQTNFTEQDPESSRTVLGGAGGIAIAADRLFVADGNRVGATPLNHRVLIYNDLGGFVPAPDREPRQDGTCPACVGVPDVVVGQPDFETLLPSNSTDIDAEFDTRDGMRNPTAVASDGRVLAVADTDNNRVLIWSNIPSRNGERSSVVVGQPDHDEIAPNTTREGLRGPQGVWIDGGRLFIADTLNSRILIYNSIPDDDGEPADIVVGQPDFETRHIPDFTRLDGKASARDLFDPVSVTVKDGRMFVTDLGHHRVLIYNTIPTANYPRADVVVGQPDMEIGLSNNNVDLCEEIPVKDEEEVVDDDDDDDGDPDAETATEDDEDEDPEPRFPDRCASTLSFPRFALSDGERLFIADGGNDRILVFDKIPDKNGAEADTVLGQPDFESIEQSDGAAHVRSPTSLAHDGTNLYVADPFTRRILVFTPGQDLIAADGVRNGASFSIHALGSILFTDPPETTDEEEEEEDEDEPVHQEVDIRLETTDKNGDEVKWKYEFEFDEDLSALQVRDIMLGMINASFDVQPDPTTGELPDTPPAYALAMDGEGTYAQARVRFGGTLQPGDQVYLQIGDSFYEHTVLEADQDPAPFIMVDRFIYSITNRPDPLVVAQRDFADDDLETLLITARNPGPAGNSIPISVRVSPEATLEATLIEDEESVGTEALLKGGSISRGIRLIAIEEGADGNEISQSVAKKGSGITTSTSGSKLTGGHDARETPPGTMTALFGQGFADALYEAQTGSTELPKQLGGVQVFANGVLCPLYSVSPEQINFQMPFEITGSSASVFVRRAMPDGSIRTAVPRAAKTTRAAPGLFTHGGSEPRQGVVLHGGGFAEGSIGISLPSGGNGDEVGDQVNVTITIQDRTYIYRTASSDTLEDVRDGIVATINAGTGDPDVVASADSRGFFSARADVIFSGNIAEGDEVSIHVRDRTYSYVIEEDDTLISVRNILVEKINAGLGDPEVTARRLEEIGTVRMQVVARELGVSGNSIPFSVSTSRNAVIIVEVPDPEDEEREGFLSGGQTPPTVVLTARLPGLAGNDITYDAESEEVEDLVVSPISGHLCCGTESYSLVTNASPAVPGETIIVFGT